MSDDSEIHMNILGYWIDEETGKSYCVVEYIDHQGDHKHSNIYLQESKYDK